MYQVCISLRDLIIINDVLCSRNMKERNTFAYWRTIWDRKLLNWAHRNYWQELGREAVQMAINTENHMSLIKRG